MYRSLVTGPPNFIKQNVVVLPHFSTEYASKQRNSHPIRIYAHILDYLQDARHVDLLTATLRSGT